MKKLRERSLARQLREGIWVQKEDEVHVDVEIIEEDLVVGTAMTEEEEIATGLQGALIETEVVMIMIGIEHLQSGLEDQEVEIEMILAREERIGGRIMKMITFKETMMMMTGGSESQRIVREEQEVEAVVGEETIISLTGSDDLIS